jgi:hypothetical protein
VSKGDLTDLLARLDEETRLRWERYLVKVDADVSERGPQVVREHLERALEHLLAVGWALHRCYAVDENGNRVMGPLGDAATTVEQLRQLIDEIAIKPEWQQ